MEIAAHCSVILYMSKLKMYFCKACLYFFCQIDLPLLYFSKAFVEKKNHMAILLYFSTEYLLSVKHRKLNFTKKTWKLLARFLYSSYTVCTIRYISYICDTIRFPYDTFLIKYDTVLAQYDTFLIRRSSYVFRYISGIQGL